MDTTIKLILSIYFGAAIIYWLQPPVYASVAVGGLVSMLVDLAIDSAGRKD